MEKENWKKPVFLDVNSLSGDVDDNKQNFVDKKKDIPPQPVKIPKDACVTPVDEDKEKDTNIKIDIDSYNLQEIRSGINIWYKIFALSFGGLLIAFILTELHQLLAIGFEQGTIWGMILLTIIIVFIGSAFLAANMEWKKFGRLKSAAGLREQGLDLQQSQDSQRCREYIHNLDDYYQNSELEGLVTSSISGLENLDRMSGQNLSTVLSQRLFKPLDKKAFEIVTKHSLEAGVLVSISPLAVADMLLILWRNIRLVQEIAHIYGLQPGLMGRLALLKNVVRNMAFVGVTEMAVDIGGDLLGWSLLSKLSAKMGQGVGAGLLTARMGIQAMHLCRPLPFIIEDKPKLKQVRNTLLAKLNPIKLANGKVQG